MNREIKFRGKDIKTGKWVYGFYLRLEDTFRKPIEGKKRITNRIYTGSADSCVAQTTGYEFYGDWYEVDPDSIGQFTGLFDKNEAEIYEGDIVKIKTLQGIVTWHPNGYFCIHTYKCDISEVSYTAIGDMVDYLHKDLYDDGLEVIGNTFDNSDLLKGGEK